MRFEKLCESGGTSVSGAYEAVANRGVRPNGGVIYPDGVIKLNFGECVSKREKKSKQRHHP